MLERWVRYFSFWQVCDGQGNVFLLFLVGFFLFCFITFFRTSFSSATMKSENYFKSVGFFQPVFGYIWNLCVIGRSHMETCLLKSAKYHLILVEISVFFSRYFIWKYSESEICWEIIKNLLRKRKTFFFSDTTDNQLSLLAYISDTSAICVLESFSMIATAKGIFDSVKIFLLRVPLDNR